MTALPSSTDVVIVGAGPTGLALACVLAGKGVDFALIERQPESPKTSRAVAIHAHTLEVLEELKVTPRLGEAYPHSFVLADVRMQWQMSADEAML
jgi:2-polyprenyl-6-methoxyphenol hydroxylase-like FAD-dependent oxidoreductase